jgi:hypothetical protein
MISDYCRKRVAVVLSPLETEALRQYLIKLLELGVSPPRLMGHDAWTDVSLGSGIPAAHLKAAHYQLGPIFDAVTRSVSRRGVTAKRGKMKPILKGETASSEITSLTLSAPVLVSKQENPSSRKTPEVYREIPVKEGPEPLWAEWEEPKTFSEALQLHIDRHGETAIKLYRAVICEGCTIDLRGFIRWCSGGRVPRSIQSLNLLSRIERRYRLPTGYFKRKIPHPARAARGHVLGEISPAERRRLAWHLPDDFNSRSMEEQEEILGWVKKVIITGSTDYRAFQAVAMKTRYSVRFRAFQGGRRRLTRGAAREDADTELDTELRSSVVDAPAALEEEMQDLLHFKTSTLTAFGFQRNGVWNEETASQKVEHLGLLFGALAASPRTAVRGFGASLDSLCFAMLIFPAVWDWYLQWRELRRGFYTNWEVDMLGIVLAMVREETGWLRQNPSLANRLKPIPGLISDDDIVAATNDWHAACDIMRKHGRNRIKEINRVVRVHRDPFEPILPILESESPVGEYRKITEEILRLMPDERRHPRAAAEMVRSFLMLRLGLHLGLRQRNLRELRVCLPGHAPATERQLEDMKCGELRWSERDGGWEVLIPSVAFKNAMSSFFGSKPFRLVLPDLGGLYVQIEAYLDRHRTRLLGPAADPSTFFIKTAKRSSTNAAYDQNTFYEAWRLAIQRYGIYNPYTGRGVIKGLLPHGPHNVRDVLATHILKKTGSYEQASYAIQDTPDMVAKHYGRFLPQDKSAIAAQILNRVWDAA